MHLDEVGFVSVDECDAGGSVRFITHNEVEVVEPDRLCFSDYVDGLVGAEHHGQSFSAFAVRHLCDQRGRIGGGRKWHVVGVNVFHRAGDLGVRAHGKGPQVHLALSGPFAQRLGQQGY